MVKRICDSCKNEIHDNAVPIINKLTVQTATRTRNICNVRLCVKCGFRIAMIFENRTNKMKGNE